MRAEKLTPNLVVVDVAAAIEFYRSVLGFQTAFTVPDNPPYVFASVSSGSVELFFNDKEAVGADYPSLAARPIGGALTLFLEIDGIEEALAAVQKSGSKIVMPLKTQFYGMREFAFEDPEGWLVTIAERVK